MEEVVVFQKRYHRTNDRLAFHLYLSWRWKRWSCLRRGMKWKAAISFIYIMEKEEVVVFQKRYDGTNDSLSFIFIMEKEEVVMFEKRYWGINDRLPYHLYISWRRKRWSCLRRGMKWKAAISFIYIMEKEEVVVFQKRYDGTNDSLSFIFIMEKEEVIMFEKRYWDIW